MLVLSEWWIEKSRIECMMNFVNYNDQGWPCNLFLLIMNRVNKSLAVPKACFANFHNFKIYIIHWWFSVMHERNRHVALLKNRKLFLTIVWWKRNSVKNDIINLLVILLCTYRTVLLNSVVIQGHNNIKRCHLGTYVCILWFVAFVRDSTAFVHSWEEI